MKTEWTKEIRGERFGEERALYASHGIHLTDCRFDGEEDGESALKESSNILVERTFCNLRYPFWHDTRLTIRESEMTEACRAPLWYSSDICIDSTRLHGVKSLRECQGTTLTACDILSPEFGWSCTDVTLDRCRAEGEYFMLNGADIVMRNTDFKGKYSFQYVKNAVIEDCVLDTKDAFWHAENVTVKNCTIKGAYLAWCANGITFDHCRIISTQPLCYCKNLKLIDCEMVDCDLAFEKSEVEATVTTHVLSIKNPKHGRIEVPSVGEIILDDPNAHGEIVIKE